VTEAFKAVAKQKGHSEALAGAMVDPEIEVVAARVDGRTELMTRDQLEEAQKKADRRAMVEEAVVVKKGKILVMTTADAVKWKLAVAEVPDRATLIANLGLGGRPVVDSKVTWADHLARFCSSGVVIGIMITVAMLALYMELHKPTGVGAGVFLTALAVYFWANYLAGTAGPISIFIFLLGVALLVVEIFFIPGFGWTGIAGIVLMVLGMVAARLPADFFKPTMPVAPTIAPRPLRWTAVLDAVTPLAAGLAVGSVGILVLMRYFPSLPLFNRLVLKSNLSAAVVTAAQAAGAASPEAMVGLVGTATTTLRPGGTARFGDKLLDVVSDGDFIDAGTQVKIVSATSNRIVVRRG
jgi:membrane-bound serine protease (ClpP class)